ncbi:MAG: OB-fold domain-containing protein [Gammaproteobacteria bacterium]|nr:OB-fold domain-containing protein [Gammaproteobacteria bacterium]MBI5617096.1 OB-fold domain-containing protein [Gammaproteobacteria bacterium]
MDAIEAFAEGVFATRGDGSGELLGGECAACGRRYFPRRDHCPGCEGRLAECGLGDRGTLYTYTVVRVRPPLGLPAPYAVGYVDLDRGPRVFALLDPQAVNELAIGMPLVMRVGPLGVDARNRPCLRPYFTPRRGE